MAHVHAPCRFKFENAWYMEPMCEVIVQDVWQRDIEANILQKIKVCSQKLGVWGKEITGNFSGRIKNCKAVMKQYRGVEMIIRRINLEKQERS